MPLPKEQLALFQTNWQNDRMAKGLCVSCGNPREPDAINKRLCKACRIRKNLANTRYDKKRHPPRVRRGLHLFQRGKTWWIQGMRNGQYIRVSTHTKDQAVAEEILKRELEVAAQPTEWRWERLTPISIQLLRNDGFKGVVLLKPDSVSETAFIAYANLFVMGLNTSDTLFGGTNPKAIAPPASSSNE